MRNLKYREKMRRIAIEKGYGKWMKGRKLPLKTRLKMKKRMIENPIKFYLGKHLSEKHRENISLGLKRKKLKHTKKFKRIMSKLMKENNPMKRPEVQKKSGESRKGQHSSPRTEFKKGQLPWNFNNYISLVPYGKDFNKKRKEKCRNIYKNYCQLCGIIQECLPEKLSIHHIDYNKENNKFENWIPLCRQCHAQTFSNKEYWTKLLKNRVRVITSAA